MDVENKRFMTSKEVAAFLCVSVRTLYNYASRHEVYRPSRPGIFHVEHVNVLECVWGGSLDEEQGLAVWRYRRMRLGKELEDRVYGRSETVKRNDVATVNKNRKMKAARKGV